MNGLVKTIGKRAPLAVALLLASASPGVRAQEGEVRSGHGYFLAGFQQLDLDELNQRLRGRGIPAFEGGFVTLGGGGHAEIGRLLLGGEGHALLEHSETSGAYQRKLAGGLGFFDVGFVLARPERVRAYALLGLGAGGINLKTYERQLPSFDEVLDEPRRASDVASGGVLAQISLGGDVLLRVRETPRGTGGLTLGARVGYVFAPWVSEWQLNGAEAAGGPEVGLGGPYLRISLGGGGSRPRGSPAAGG
jgi:hypothetical protein